MRNSGFAAAFLAILTVPLNGATLEQMPLDDIIRESTAIVRGRAGDGRSVRSGALIFTVTRFEIAEQWKGHPVGEIDIWLPGGRVGSLSQTFGGVPQLSPGQDFVAFLWTGPSGHTQIIGLSQGLFSIEKRGSGEVAIRKASADLMLEPNSFRPVQAAAIEMPIGDLRAQVEAASAPKR
jgi:hypothetical protein